LDRNLGRLAPLLACVLGAVIALASPAQADEAGLKALAAGGHVAIVRHGLTTPGVGDPQGFRLEDCATQRNLVEEGREQARALGRLLRKHGVKIERVLSSEWCRCLETAALMRLGEAGTLPALNNLLGRPELRDTQVRELRAVIAAWKGSGTLLLVSHGATIAALMGINPREAEGVVLAPAPETAEGFRLVGKIGPSG
jgi:broad specificity phosphatase PhoE